MLLERYKSDDFTPFIRAFGRAMAGVVFIFILLLIWLELNKTSTLEEIKKNIDSKVVEIEIFTPSKVISASPPTLITDVQTIDLEENPKEDEIKLEETEEKLTKIETPIPAALDVPPLAIPNIDMEKAEKIDIISDENISDIKQQKIENTDYLYEQTEYGKYTPVPIKKHGKKNIFEVMSKHVSIDNNAPKISLIYEEYGLSEKKDKEIIDNLSNNITFLLSPNVDNAEEKAIKIHDTNRELWMDLPVDSFDYPDKDVGGIALLLSNSISENKSNLQKILSTFPYYAGVVFTGDASFFLNKEESRITSKFLKERGIAIFSRKKKYGTLLEKMAEIDKKMIYGYADIHIDASQSLEKIDNAFYELERMAEKKGNSIGIFKGYPITIKKIKEWETKLEEKGIKIVPLSQVIKQRVTSNDKQNKQQDNPY